MLAIKCRCPEGPWLPILVKTLKNKRQFIFAHCVFCGKNITWMSADEAKIRKDQDVQEVPEGDIKAEQMEWYRKKVEE